MDNSLMLVSDDHLREIAKDLGVLGKFVAVYCRHHHEGPRAPFAMKGMDLAATSLGKREVCAECAKLLAHAVTKRAMCPLTPKPACRLCTEHCYADEYREKIREVMRFSGRHLILRGHLHLLFHFLERPPKKPPERVDRICRKR
ncbi:MAG: nitrous oxide-stimulated promoter family protein [Planctomycetota bacterium]